MSSETAAKRMPPRYLHVRPPWKGEKASPEYRVRLLLTELVERGVQLLSHNAHGREKGRYRLDGRSGMCSTSRSTSGSALAGDGPLEITPLVAP